MVRQELITAIKAARWDYPQGENDPAEIHVATLEDLGRLIVETRALFQWAPDTENVEAVVAHEGEHAQVVAAFGGEHHFALQFARVGSQAFYAPVTKATFSGFISPIEEAAIYAHPTVLSDRDKMRIQQLGYRDADEVGAALQAINTAQGYDLPLPKSYQQ